MQLDSTQIVLLFFSVQSTFHLMHLFTIISKELRDYDASHEILFHYQSEIDRSKQMHKI